MTERGRLRARALLVESFTYAMRAIGATQRAAAMMVGVRPITVHRWLHGESSLDVERILAEPNLARPFREYLCTYDHSKHSIPYVAKKRGSR